MLLSFYYSRLGEHHPIHSGSCGVAAVYYDDIRTRTQTRGYRQQTTPARAEEVSYTPDYFDLRQGQS